MAGCYSFSFQTLSAPSSKLMLRYKRQLLAELKRLSCTFSQLFLALASVESLKRKGYPEGWPVVQAAIETLVMSRGTSWHAAGQDAA